MLGRRQKPQSADSVSDHAGRTKESRARSPWRRSPGQDAITGWQGTWGAPSSARRSVGAQQSRDLQGPPVVTRGPEVSRPGPGLLRSWSPRGRNGKRRGEAEAAFQLGGWRRPGRAPGALRPPELGPRPPSGSHRGTARTFPQPGGPWKHLNLSPTHDHQVSSPARSGFLTPDSDFLLLHRTIPSPRAHSTPAPGLGGPSHHTGLPPPQRPPVAPRTHSFCSLQHPGLTGTGLPPQQRELTRGHTRAPTHTRAHTHTINAYAVHQHTPQETHLAHTYKNRATRM